MPKLAVGVNLLPRRVDVVTRLVVAVRHTLQLVKNITQFCRILSHRGFPTQFGSPLVGGDAGVAGGVGASSGGSGIHVAGEFAALGYEFALVYARRRGVSAPRSQMEQVGGNGADGGVDLRLWRYGTTAIVQCKRWNTYKA